MRRMQWRRPSAWREPRPTVAEQPEPGPQPTTDRVARGRLAQQLLDDPTLVAALKAIEDDLGGTWRNSKVGAVEEREAAYRMVYAIEALRAKLRSYVTDGRVIETRNRQAEAQEAADRGEA